MLLKTIAHYTDTASGYSWSHSNYGDYAAPANARAAFDTWNTVYLGVCSVQVELQGLTIIKVNAGLPSLFFPGVGFATPAGTQAIPCPPTADGFMIQGWGSPVTKGRSDWLLHGVSAVYATNTNLWTTTSPALLGVVAAALAWFEQYRPAASPVRAYPVVNPPIMFDTFVGNDFIRLRRVGRLFQRGGQGLRSR